MEGTLPNRARFGGFELDLKAGELCKDGQTVLLQEQPSQVLQMLVLNAGKLVTREEIQKKLWPNDTVVEFDHGINTAIQKLRQALGDSADKPSYIQTVARRGYRLIAPVERVDSCCSVEPFPEAIYKGKDEIKLESSPLTGKTVSHYRLLDIIGGGGMGVVYRAEDLKLGRAVALKFLPEELGDNPRALERFSREARTASALDHPNICSIYQFGEHEGRPFIVMQLLQGENLRDRLAAAAASEKHALPLPQLLDIGIQVSDGLQAAHEKGVIHRDIKPANIFVTDKGLCKILDFGLAKLLEDRSEGEVAAQPEAPTGDLPTSSVAAHLTRTGAAMGTAGYMSPEQVRGEKLDERTDLFSLGLVLYEMAIGRRAFSGQTAPTIYEAILNHPPAPAQELNSEPLPELEAVINRALEKDRSLRYQSAAEMRAELQRLKRGTESSPDSAITTPSGSPAQQGKGWSRRRITIVGTTVLMLIVASALAYLWLRPEPVPRVSNYVQLTHDGRQKTLIGTEGSRLYFSSTRPGDRGMLEMSTSGDEETRIPVLPSPAFSPLSLSPDGSRLLAVEMQSYGMGPLWSLPLLGGSPRRMGDLVGQDAAWSPDGKSLAYCKGSSTVFIAKADGTESRMLVTMKDPAVVYDPVWSPDGKRLRFDVADSRSGYPLIWEVSVDGTGLHRLLPGWTNSPDYECCGRWTTDGKYFLFSSRRQIWALPRKAGPFQNQPNPIQLTFSPLVMANPTPSTDGKKLFVVGTRADAELMRYDMKSGQFLPFMGGISAEFASFSKDGKWIAYVSYPNGALWRSKVDGSERLQMPSDLFPPPSRAFLPRWSPDGKTIVFFEAGSHRVAKIYEVSAEGMSPHLLMPDDQSQQWDPNWSPDGSKIVFGGAANDPSSTIRILDLKTHQVDTLPGSQGLFSPRWSPDGRYVAAFSVDSTRLLLFDFETRTWIELAKGRPGWPEFSHDGRYLQFLDLTGSGTVWRIHLSDGKKERVVDLKDFVSAGYYGSSLTIAPDDSPLLPRDSRIWDIYSLDWEEP